jgi:hypothetical protein
MLFFLDIPKKTRSPANLAYTYFTILHPETPSNPNPSQPNSELCPNHHYIAANTNTAAAPPTTHWAFPVVLGTPAVLLGPLAAVPDTPVEDAVLLPEAAVFVEDEAEVVILVEDAVLGELAIAPAVIVTI